MPDSDILNVLLPRIVPGWIEILRPLSEEERAVRMRDCAQFMESQGDDILFRSRNVGESSEALNRLAEGIACLAFEVGGVDAFGMHFEAAKPVFVKRRKVSDDD